MAARVPPADDLLRRTNPSDHGKPMLRSSFAFSSPLKKREMYPASCARVSSSSVARGACICSLPLNGGMMLRKVLRNFKVHMHLADFQQALQ